MSESYEGRVAKEAFANHLERTKSVLWEWVQYLDEQKTGVITGIEKPHPVISITLSKWYKEYVTQ